MIDHNIRNFTETKAIPEESLWTTYWKNLVASLPSLVFSGIAFTAILFAFIAIIFSAFDEGSSSNISEEWILLPLLAIPVTIFFKCAYLCKYAKTFLQRSHLK